MMLKIYIEIGVTNIILLYSHIQKMNKTISSKLKMHREKQKDYKMNLKVFSNRLCLKNLVSNLILKECGLTGNQSWNFKKMKFK